MRGTRRRRIERETVARFIPAHAGNTPSVSAWRAFRPVHPRACGEHPNAMRAAWIMAGSSPRMRGTLVGRDRRGIDPRFIPAHAGNTTGRMARHFKSTVHPRACGEHSPPGDRYATTAGSSPRMRGTQEEPPGNNYRKRFIPAHAGNTSLTSAAPSSVAVHPRACGEHPACRLMPIWRGGSSPRMRGTRYDRPPRISTLTVHPRACGEHSCGLRVRWWRVGSSPRMRGTLSSRSEG